MKSYLLIDRSGSMQDQWIEVTGGVTNYCDGIDGKLAIVVFDHEIDVIHDGKSKKFNVADALAKNTPRGMTALFDGIGRLNEMIEIDQKKKAQIVIATDGYENASKEISHAQAKEMIGAWEQRGYDVIWMGAEFSDVDAQAKNLGVSAKKVVNVLHRRSQAGTMSAVAQRAMAYSAGDVKSDEDLGDLIREAAENKS